MIVRWIITRYTCITQWSRSLHSVLILFKLSVHQTFHFCFTRQWLSILSFSSCIILWKAVLSNDHCLDSAVSIESLDASLLLWSLSWLSSSLWLNDESDCELIILFPLLDIKTEIVCVLNVVGSSKFVLKQTQSFEKTFHMSLVISVHAFWSELSGRITRCNCKFTRLRAQVRCFHFWSP